MSAGSDADNVPQGSVPAPRREELPLPPAAMPAGPQDGDITDNLAEAYWSLHDGAASQAAVGQILARLPRIVRGFRGRNEQFTGDPLRRHGRHDGHNQAGRPAGDRLLSAGEE